jgi:hypothetical protein
MDEPLAADEIQQSLQESLEAKPIYSHASGSEISSVLQNALPASNPGFRVDPNQINTPFGKVSMNKAIKKTYFKGQAKEWSKYSMRIYPEKADFNHFYYLIIDQNKKGKNRGKIIAMESTQPLNYRNGRANFASFTGLYSVYHLNGDLQIQVPLKNGKLDKAALSGMRAEECEWEMGLVRICVGTPETGGWNNDEEWNTNIDEDCPGGWVWEVDLTLVCSPDDDGGGTGYVPDYPEDPEFPGGPGSGGDPVEEPVEIDYKDVKNSCLRMQVEEIINSSLKNTILLKLNDYFGINSNLDIKIEDLIDDAFFSSPSGKIIDGKTWPLIQNDDLVRVDIFLNRNTLPTSSKELIQAVIIHELVHAILSKEKGDWKQGEQHEHIRENYIQLMADILRGHFPNLPTNHDVYLAWGGLEETTGFSNLNGSLKELIIATGHNYRNGNDGNYCE